MDARLLVLKVCPRCEKSLVFSKFRVDKRYSDGKYCHCKSCEKATKKKCYEKKKQHYIDKAKNYKKRHPMKTKLWARKQNNKRRNISTKDYDKLYNKQQGRCAICGIHQSELNYFLCADHNHITLNERGLLCKVCNLGIANLKTDECGIDLLKAAIKYIKETDGIRKI